MNTFLKSQRGKKPSDIENFVAPFIDGVQLSQGYAATLSAQLTSYHSENDWRKVLYFGKNLMAVKNVQLFFLRNSKKAAVALVK